MRSRNIKPGFFTSEQLLACEPLARILFTGLWCMADREGRLEDRPVGIKIKLLPTDNCDPNLLLEQLHNQGLIERYRVNDIGYIQICAFLQHQKPHLKEVASTIPAPERADQGQEKIDKKEIDNDQHQPRQVSAPTQTLASRASSFNPSSLIPHPESNGANAPKARARDPAGFETFWSLYPKTNCSRKEALQAYTKALNREPNHETIIRGAEAYNRFLAATGSPAAHATTWLNGDRWTVDYAAATAARAKPVASQPAANSRVNAALAGLYRAGNRHGNQQQSGPVQRSGGTETTGWSKAADGAREAEIVMDDAPGRAASNPGIAGEIIAPLPHAESG